MGKYLEGLYVISQCVFFLTISLLAATFGVANSLDPSSVDPHLKVFLKEFFEKVNFEKSQQTTTKA